MFIILFNCQLRKVGTQIKDDLICNIIRFPFNQENGKWKIISPVDLCQVHFSTTTSFFETTGATGLQFFMYTIYRHIFLYIYIQENKSIYFRALDAEA